MSATTSDHVDQKHIDAGAVHVHIASTPFYATIFCCLVVLTVLTVVVSYFDFGAANIVLALLIATMKGSLVATFFMHLRHDKLFNTISFLGAFLFLGVFILLSYDDIAKRGQLDNSYGGQFDLRTGQAAPGGEPATSSTQDSREHEGPETAGAHEAPGAATTEKKE